MTDNFTCHVLRLVSAELVAEQIVIEDFCDRCKMPTPAHLLVESGDRWICASCAKREPPADATTTFPTGATRSSDAENERFDLITPIGLRRLAESYAEGARKYGDHNWQRGMPASQMINRALRHIYLWLEGDEEEDHLAHAAWNLLGICHFEEVMPEMIDIPARMSKTS